LVMGGVTIRPVCEASDKDVLKYLQAHPNESLADVVVATAYDMDQVARLMKKQWTDKDDRRLLQKFGALPPMKDRYKTHYAPDPCGSACGIQSHQTDDKNKVNCLPCIHRILGLAKRMKRGR